MVSQVFNNFEITLSLSHVHRPTANGEKVKEKKYIFNCYKYGNEGHTARIGITVAKIKQRLKVMH